MTKLSDIAKQTGLSVSAICDILHGRGGYNDETRRKVINVARKLNYKANPNARQLLGLNSHVFGVLVGTGDEVVNFDRLLALENEAFKKGYRLLIGQIHKDESRTTEYMQDFAARGVDGIIWLRQPFNKRLIAKKEYFKKMTNILFLDEALISGSISVTVDYSRGIEQAYSHLKNKGRERIGLAIASKGIPGDPMDARQKGFLKSSDNDKAMMWIGDGNPIPTSDAINNAIECLVIKNNADAIIASNDFWAVEFIRQFRRRKIRVPDDVAVIGYDNLVISRTSDPELTTIDQQHEIFAEKAIDALSQSVMSMGDLPVERNINIKPKLIERATT